MRDSCTHPNGAGGSGGGRVSWDSLWYGPPDLRSRVLAPLLAPLSWAFSGATALRGALYDLGLKRPARVGGATVVSVGNLVVGGAGKTPVIIFLARWATACGRRVAVLSRGHGRMRSDDVVFTDASLPPARDVGDEPRLIARRCPGVEVSVGPGRARTAAKARERGADFILLDDGFQHRQLHRDVDLVVWADPGNGRRLPWGPLREPVSALARATLLWAPERVTPPPMPVVRARARLTGLVTPSGAPLPLRHLEGRSVVLLTGIARPWRVRQSLEALGVTVAEALAHPDHHVFSLGQLAAARDAAARHGALVVTTEKDAQRLPADFDALALRLEVEVTEGLDLLASTLGLDKALVPTAGE